MRTLGKLLTDLGERPLYEAAAQCTRCGFCEQACPTYVRTGKESYSPRGRNQLVRMLLEGKLAEPASAEEALASCLLCGACTTICPAHVPTADIVLEGRRALRPERPPAPVRLLTWLLAERPRLLEKLLRWAYRLHRWGFAALAARSGLLRVAGLDGLGEAAGHLGETPRRLLSEELEGDPAFAASGRPPAWLYFSACGTNYLFPRVGKATARVLAAVRGPGARLEHPCCGLVSYNYGDLDSAREFARRNIAALEAAGAPEAPLVGDCSSCVAHLKAYPQLFLDEPEWKARAERFAARARDVIECVPDSAARPLAGEGPLTYHDSCRARNGQGLCAQPRGPVRAAAGGAYRELPEAEACCGGAGAFAFLQPALSDALLRRKTAMIASTHARVVAVSSTSCLLQLERGLRKYYPECRAVHFSELLAESLQSLRHG